MEIPSGSTAHVVEPRPRWDLWAFLGALAVLSAGAVAGSVGLGVWLPQGPGPGFFPLVLGAGILLLTLAWAVQAVRRPADIASAEHSVDVRGVASGLLGLIAVGVVLPWLGFQLTIFAFLLFQLAVRGRVGWPLSLAIALIGSVGCFHLFNDFLQVGLPVSAIPGLSSIGI